MSACIPLSYAWSLGLIEAAEEVSLKLPRMQSSIRIHAACGTGAKKLVHRNLRLSRQGGIHAWGNVGEEIHRLRICEGADAMHPSDKPSIERLSPHMSL